MYCTKCGNKIKRLNKFCTKCGQKNNRKILYILLILIIASFLLTALVINIPTENQTTSSKKELRPARPKMPERPQRPQRP